MRFLTRLFGSDEDDTYDTRTEDRERDLVVEFDRVTVAFGFVNGGDRTIEYDEFDGRFGEHGSDGVVHSVENGIHVTERAGVQVEKLCEINHAQPVREFDNGNTLLLYGDETHEVTPGNVTDRTVLDRDEMQVAVPVTETVTLREDTGEVVSRNTPKRNGDMRIEPRD